ncbi:nucleoside triphosphate pyrophosphohydrolase [Larsenimonas suaedae]|uniref:Nucleoside triphosphate pyrophosphohydrolase n=1 Tax=Larsenimonas suaedae TaxID=1851019 RepID=A0ABU1GV04_9GAMM|nr:nucleoside triphosphate pyrophosphohydrolase [Larsenimonas suaedae]MCM2971159.1 nucleoside triphosphate pyrophosphohydrolase [Larsenimonas suaedae]MDR5895868.1 nucleoside triphosphate pyrophosphohydrolase [Larsenimonas suaedae]
MTAATPYTLSDLRYLMATLRDPEQGCPWDLKQRFETIVPHTIEEAYEVADAIECKAFDELPGELGDLLFQVVFYAQIADEDARFDLDDVIDTLVRKMVRRHPHVFLDGTLYGEKNDGNSQHEASINARWEAIKAYERETRDASSLLDDVPVGLPALTRAGKLSKRAARGGFDWPDARGALAKVHEELAELEQAMAEGQADACEDELGDVLFSVVNLARKQGIDPEQALRRTNAKFERRFRYVERAIGDEGGALESASLDTMEAHWQAAKRQER